MDNKKETLKPVGGATGPAPPPSPLARRLGLLHVPVPLLEYLCAGIIYDLFTLGLAEQRHGRGVVRALLLPTDVHAVAVSAHHAFDRNEVVLRLEGPDFPLTAPGKVIPVAEPFYRRVPGAESMADTVEFAGWYAPGSSRSTYFWRRVNGFLSLEEAFAPAVEASRQGMPANPDPLPVKAPVGKRAELTWIDDPVGAVTPAGPEVGKSPLEWLNDLIGGFGVPRDVLIAGPDAPEAVGGVTEIKCCGQIGPGSAFCDRPPGHDGPHSGVVKEFGSFRWSAENPPTITLPSGPGIIKVEAGKKARAAVAAVYAGDVELPGSSPETTPLPLKECDGCARAVDPDTLVPVADAYRIRALCPACREGISGGK